MYALLGTRWTLKQACASQSVAAQTALYARVLGNVHVTYVKQAIFSLDKPVSIIVLNPFIFRAMEAILSAVYHALQSV
jgi:hypothetical protein